MCHDSVQLLRELRRGDVGGISVGCPFRRGLMRQMDLAAQYILPSVCEFYSLLRRLLMLREDQELQDYREEEYFQEGWIDRSSFLGCDGFVEM